ncbi:MAG: helix-turn-helix domain-containing protein [Lachnospiraceae bacterium]|nr:helix-turn-helix domain-containing protein [Lachnospiraceae bacterium]
MYKMLIVDDESTERECISYLIQSANLPLELKEAESVSTALELLKTWPADILFTDIRMPASSGLDLARKAAELLPGIKTIIFSSYAEFEYARTAMTLGAVSYILKPVVPNELEATLTDVIHLLSEERDMKLLQDTQQSYMLQYALHGCINGTLPAGLSPEIIRLLNEFHQVVLLDFPPHFLEKNYAVFYEKLRCEMQLDMETLSLSSTQSVLFLRRQTENARAFGCRLHAYIQESFQTSCHLAISQPIHGYSDLQDAYTFAEQQMEQRFWNPENPVFSYEDIGLTGRNQDELDDRTILSMVKRSLCDKDSAGLTQNLNLLFQKYRQPAKQSEIFVKFVFSNLITTLYPFLPDGAGQPLDTLITELYIQQDILEIIRTIQSMADKIVQSYRCASALDIRREIVSTQNYIHQNYSRDLSVEMLASLVYLTPDYLSRLFKKSTGKSLSQYIRQVRMERASELLRTTSRKVIDIGTSVGYANYSYFCQSFREYFGRSPEKYRQEESL